MVASKAWTWEISDDPVWENPSEDVYYYVERWKEKGFHDILDLGCGMGRNTCLFSKNGFNTFGIDLSEYGVEKTNARLKREELEGSIRCGDINELPYADDSFDGLLAYHVISHTDSKGIITILNEMKRVVRKGGELYFTLCSKDSPSFANEKYERIDDNTIIKNDGPEQDIPHFYIDETELPNLIQGLKVIRLRHIKDIFDGSYGCHYFIHCENLKQ